MFFNFLLFEKNVPFLKLCPYKIVFPSLFIPGPYGTSPIATSNDFFVIALSIG